MRFKNEQTNRGLNDSEPLLLTPKVPGHPPRFSKKNCQPLMGCFVEEVVRVMDMDFDSADPNKQIVAHICRKTNNIQIECAVDGILPLHYSIVGIGGKQQVTGSLYHSKTKVDLSGLLPGIYLLIICKKKVEIRCYKVLLK